MPGGLTTTVIGSFPKPKSIAIPDWFSLGTCRMDGSEYEQYYSSLSEEEKLNVTKDIELATKEVIDSQVKAGIDIPTDGEIRRDNYIFYYLRFIKGIDCCNPEEKTLRNGAYKAKVPVIKSKVEVDPENLGFMAREYQLNQAMTSAPVKVTLPGPTTIADTTLNKHYENQDDLLMDLAVALNAEILELVKAGCTHIQIDEPLWARFPENALRIGIPVVKRALKDVPSSVNRVIHACCGYPDHVDQEGYLKADPKAYHMIAPALDQAECIDAVSIEDAHRKNDPTLLSLFKKTKVILGCVAIAKSRVESVEEVQERLHECLKYIDADRLIVAPDCGLAMLPTNTALAKLQVLCDAAKSIDNQ